MNYPFNFSLRSLHILPVVAWVSSHHHYQKNNMSGTLVKLCQSGGALSSSSSVRLANHSEGAFHCTQCLMTVKPLYSR